VLPAAIPVTVPVLETLAMPEAELVHVPPETEAVSESEDPTHKVDAPEIVPATGAGLTVTAFTTNEVPQPETKE
jgi:hypothetical protein